MPLKRHYIDFQKQTDNKVTPDEIDRYEVYNVINPAISATGIGSATAGTVSQAVAVGFVTVKPDYPRALLATWSGSASVSGTVVVVGKNQFGGDITENFVLAQGTQEAGTDTSTEIFAELTSATATFGTGAIGSGTVSLGYAIAGTAARFGLPAKIGGTLDVKHITWTDESGVSTPLNGGTIGAYVGTAQHTFAGTETLAGTMTLTAWYRPTFIANGDSLAKMANL